MYVKDEQLYQSKTHILCKTCLTVPPKLIILRLIVHQGVQHFFSPDFLFLVMCCLQGFFLQIYDIVSFSFQSKLNKLVHGSAKIDWYGKKQAHNQL